MLSMREDLQELRKVLDESKTLPVLFIGSGLSRRYLGSPTWRGLLEYASTLIGRSLNYYEGLASDGPTNLKLARVASLIAKDFYPIWWESAEYASSREKYQSIIETNSDPLKIELTAYLQNLDITDDEAMASELEKLSAVHAHAVITTNYDSLMEDSLPDMEVYVGQQSVLFSATQSVGEIYKIHGSVADPTSLILTEEDYREYWVKNPYLIAKILTLFVEHPIILIGYSLGDAHIQRLLGNLVDCLTEAQLNTLNRRLIFINRAGSAADVGFEESSITVEKHSFHVRSLKLEDYGELYALLADLPQHFPVRMLRQLRESVYQLAYSSEPTGRVYVLPFDEAQEDEVEVVVGVGTMERLGLKGYSVFTRSDLFLDMLKGATDHNAENMINALMPAMFRGAKFSPIWYPLWIADREGLVVDRQTLPRRAIALLEGETILAPYPSRRPTNWEALSFTDLVAAHPDLATNLGVGCRYDVSDVLMLRDYLRPRVEGKATVPTDVAKLCVKFDRLVYGSDFEGDRVALLAALGFD